MGPFHPSKTDFFLAVTIPFFLALLYTPVLKCTSKCGPAYVPVFRAWVSEHGGMLHYTIIDNAQ